LLGFLTMKQAWFAILFLFAVAGVAEAKSVYVSDVLYITLRTGKGDSFRILKTLKSGTKMELMEKDDQYAQVRLEDGTEGWVQERFITDDPTSNIILESTNNRLSRLQNDYNQLKEKYDSTRSELSQTEKERSSLESRASKLEKQNTEIQDAAARPIQLDRENKELRTKNAEMAKEIADLKIENESLKGASDRDWFMTGAGVIILGVLIGLIVPRLRLRKQSSWA